MVEKNKNINLKIKSLEEQLSEKNKRIKELQNVKKIKNTHKKNISFDMFLNIFSK